ncbi:MAG TPA: THUMP domain-containing protein [Nitrosopumilaceae archaeon]|nr:THUMP domain-containing protein [Nitrosopumilaceae archaeon]
MNLIITCPRHFEEEASNEVTEILTDLGDKTPKITISNMPGILTGFTSLEPIKSIKKIREKILDEPWFIRYCLRIIPIQAVCKTSIEEIEGEILKKAEIIKPENKYRITIEKRNSKISSEELISKIAKNFTNKVSLEKPDWIILIEIIGEITGISFIQSNDVLSVEKTKRSLSD